MAIGLALLVAIAAGIVWYLKMHPKAAQKSVKRNLTNTRGVITGTAKNTTASKAINSGSAHKYHSVLIQSKEGCCAAVKAIANQRFLTNVAPAIPLQGCDAENCRCNYVHFSDRREEEDDRRSMYSIQTELYRQAAERDRRGKRGRREDDIDY